MSMRLVDGDHHSQRRTLGWCKSDKRRDEARMGIAAIGINLLGRSGFPGSAETLKLRAFGSAAFDYSGQHFGQLRRGPAAQDATPYCFRFKAHLFYGA